MVIITEIIVDQGQNSDINAPDTSTSKPAAQVAMKKPDYLCAVEGSVAEYCRSVNLEVGEVYVSLSWDTAFDIIESTISDAQALPQHLRWLTSPEDMEKAFKRLDSVHAKSYTEVQTLLDNDPYWSRLGV